MGENDSEDVPDHDRRHPKVPNRIGGGDEEADLAVKISDLAPQHPGICRWGFV